MTRALITGCSSGIGRATCVELTKRGIEVVATARRPESIADLDVAQTIALDVNDEASIANAVREAGEVDVLVNNAGFGVHGPIEKVPMEEVRKVFETNVFGVARMMQAFIPQMRERQSGTIVNLSSIAGRVSSPLGGFYSATKFAVEALSEAAHYELAHFGIRIVLVEPGGFDTRFDDNRAIFGCDEPPYDELDRQWDRASETLVQGERPGPEPVAQAIADAIEAEEPVLRWPVGEDAQMVLAVRAEHDDASFEATMRTVLDLTW